MLSLLWYFSQVVARGFVTLEMYNAQSRIPCLPFTQPPSDSALCVHEFVLDAYIYACMYIHVCMCASPDRVTECPCCYPLSRCRFCSFAWVKNLTLFIVSFYLHHTLTQKVNTNVLRYRLALKKPSLFVILWA